MSETIRNEKDKMVPILIGTGSMRPSVLLGYHYETFSYLSKYSRRKVAAS